MGRPRGAARLQPLHAQLELPLAHDLRQHSLVRGRALRHDLLPAHQPRARHLRLRLRSGHRRRQVRDLVLGVAAGRRAHVAALPSGARGPTFKHKIQSSKLQSRDH